MKVWVHPFTTPQGRSAWLLQTERTAYAFGLDDHGVVQHLYWGPSLPAVADYGEPEALPAWAHENPEGVSQAEYTAWGGLDYSEPCLKLTYSDGVRAAKLVFDRAELGATNLALILRDPDYGLTVDVHYQVFPEHDLLERRAMLFNEGQAALELEQVYSARLNLPPRDLYRLTSLAGRWGGESQIQCADLTLGKTVLEGRSGITGFAANPAFMLAADATETHGEVWFGALAYSGNWQLVAERNAHGQTTLSGGVSSFDFRWRLEPGERFETPGLVAGFTALGYGEASRLLHAYVRGRVLPQTHAGTPRPVLYNSWYVTGFDVNEANQKEAASAAAALGAELFVMDDGWFGERDDDTAGLGDWWVNREKFPAGLGPLIEHVNGLGMAFGLWVEPEMVNPDSDLYRAHPDWVVSFPNRPRSEARHQLVLNLAQGDVQAYVFGFLDRLLAEHDIEFLKWDMNRPFSEPGWAGAPPGRAREIWVRHTRALYDILARLRAKHPGVMLESCASGGGRVDLGILAHTDQVWTSDNTDPFDVLRMHEGYSLFYPAKVRMAWVTDPPTFSGRFPSLRYRFHVAMTGALGVGADLPRWSQGEKEEAKNLIALYKEIRSTVQDGSLYRLRSPRDHALAALQYLSPSGHEAVVFAFLHSSSYGEASAALRLRGLEPDRLYRVDDGPEASGQALMARGLGVSLRGSFESCLYRIRRVDA